MSEKISQDDSAATNESIYSRLAYTLFLIQFKTRRRIQELFKPFGLSLNHIQVLGTLNLNMDKPMTIKQILSSIIDDGINVSRVVDRLNQDNLVIKEVDPLDKRNANIRISPKGKMLLNQITEESTKMIKHYEILDEQEAESVNNLLNKLLKELPNSFNN